MFRIAKKVELAPQVKQFDIEAPLIANKHQAGQFIILRIDEEGERIPLTIANTSLNKGQITIVFQEVGKTTLHLGTLKEGDYILDVIGPLGVPTHIETFGTVVCVGGGIGIAPIHPIAQALKKAGNRVISIIGARTRDLLIMEQELKAASTELIVTTDDGSYGIHGFVTNEVQRLINEKVKIDLLVGIGPVVMMRALCNVTKPHHIKTLVSLNSIMVDGTGMCGACRVTVHGKTRFVCVEGPEFDGHGVDFDELMKRQRIYLREEEMATKEFVKCQSCSGGAR